MRTCWFSPTHLLALLLAVLIGGRAAYDLPTYVHAALWEPGEEPGEYPSGGPLPHLRDVGRAAAPTLDFLAPDIYFPIREASRLRWERSDRVVSGLRWEHSDRVSRQLSWMRSKRLA